MQSLVPSFIKTAPGATIKAPVGGDFTPRGFVGKFAMTIMWFIWSEIDLEKDLKLPFTARRKMGQGWRYYFDTAEAGEVARRELDAQYGATQCVYLRADLDNVLNISDEHRDKFSNVLTFEARMTTLRSDKYRHETFMLFAPSVIAALARSCGEDIEFNTNDIIRADIEKRNLVTLLDESEAKYAEAHGRKDPDEVVYTDEFQFKVIGSREANPGDDDHYTNSSLWRQRAAIWAALGEPDPSKYLPKGAEEGGTRYEKHITESDQLSGLLHFVTSDWDGEVWCRVTTVSDPRVDGFYTRDDEIRRLSLPTITEFYADRAAAQVAADEDLARMAGSTSGSDSTATTATGAPDVPTAYAPTPDIWEETVREAMSTVPDSASPPKIRSKAAEKFIKANGGDSFGATPAELLAWVDHLSPA